MKDANMPGECADIPRILVALATYNERDSLPTLAPAIHDQLPTAHVLVIDDNSPDGTGQLAQELADQHSWARVRHRPGKLGLGSALRDAVTHALENNYDFLITLDADGSHPPKFLPDLMTQSENHDVVIGSRYAPGGQIIGWPFYRRLMSRSINFYTRLCLGLPTRDNSGSYRCYRVAMLEKLDLDHLEAAGYVFLQEILFHCHRARARFFETPISFEDRQFGKSKLTITESYKALSTITRLAWRYRLRRTKSR